jgi:hypothetical protein
MLQNIGATSRKATGSIPDVFFEFSNLPNPSSHNMALGTTQASNGLECKESSGM